MNNNLPKEVFQGVWPAMFTPVFDNGDLNVKELEKLIELLIEQDVDGLYLLGSTGQGFLFNEKQRREITEITLKINNNRLPVMVQVGALNTDESVRLAKHAEQCGVQAISAVGPIYYAASPAMALEHYRKIASSVEIPFFPYQIGNAVMNKEMIQQLKKISNMGGMKLTTHNLIEISNIHNDVGPDWKLFSGADELLCHAALCGTAGAIGSTYNLIGYACKDIRQKFLDGQVATGIAFMLRLQKLIEQVLPSIWTFFNRAMLLKHGINIGKPKPPLLFPDLAWSDEEILRVIEELESFSTNRIPA
ncbi:MAG: dihydrodipicolinate synthase family protein [Chitinophagaceae bacterium]|nr:dihydrodipicolinate synthase family protein [Chitinophagaceae bacterium]MCW5927296.1 dihydrodipicolinate synthase family protein [Chitinophagaceae bacterium]